MINPDFISGLVVGSIFGTVLGFNLWRLIICICFKLTRKGRTKRNRRVRK